MDGMGKKDKAEARARVLLERYFDGTSSRADERELRHLCAESEDMSEETVRELDMFLRCEESIAAAGEMPKDFEKMIAAEIGMLARGDRRGPRRRMRRVLWLRIGAAAAVIAVVVLAGVHFANLPDDVTARETHQDTLNIGLPAAEPSKPERIANADRQTREMARKVVSPSVRGVKADVEMESEEESLSDQLKYLDDKYGVAVEPLLCFADCDEKGMQEPGMVDEGMLRMGLEVDQFYDIARENLEVLWDEVELQEP